jgi:CheY-like chemotaxis protein
MHKILVVEDAEDVRYFLTRLLRFGGFATDAAEDGRAALARLELALPDLVLLDLMMPVMNGLEMLTALRGDPRWQHLPVVLYTAMADEGLLNDAEKLGIQDVIFKGSVDGSELLDRLAARFPPAVPAPASPPH